MPMLNLQLLRCSDSHARELKTVMELGLTSANHDAKVMSVLNYLVSKCSNMPTHSAFAS